MSAVWRVVVVLVVSGRRCQVWGLLSLSDYSCSPLKQQIVSAQVDACADLSVLTCAGVGACLLHRALLSAQALDTHSEVASAQVSGTGASKKTQSTAS